MSSHEEISTELLRGLGHSILTMIVLLPWFFHEVVWKVDLFFKEDRIDFGGAALTLLSSHFSLLLHKVSSSLLYIPSYHRFINCIKHLTIIIINIYINIIKILA